MTREIRPFPIDLDVKLLYPIEFSHEVYNRSFSVRARSLKKYNSVGKLAASKINPVTQTWQSRANRALYRSRFLSAVAAAHILPIQLAGDRGRLIGVPGLACSSICMSSRLSLSLFVRAGDNATTTKLPGRCSLLTAASTVASLLSRALSS